MASLKSIWRTSAVTLPSGSLPKKGLCEPGRLMEGFACDNTQGAAINGSKTDNAVVRRQIFRESCIFDRATPGQRQVPERLSATQPNILPLIRLAGVAMQNH